jgi:hypothetical protein
MPIAAAAINPDASTENGVVNVASIHSVSKPSTAWNCSSSETADSVCLHRLAATPRRGY